MGHRSGPVSAMETPPASSGHGGLCGATKRDGTPCAQPAGFGTGHVGAGSCKFHTGSTPNGEAHGRQLLAERDAARSLADLGYEPVTDPLDALADLAAKAVALSKHFADRVADLEEYRYESDGKTEQVRAELLLLERYMLMAQKFLRDWVQLGFDERRVRLDEVRAARVGVLLEWWARANGIDARSPRQLELLDLGLPILDGATPPAIEAIEVEAQ